MSYNNNQLKKDMLRKKGKRSQLFLTGKKWGDSSWRFIYNVVLSYDGDLAELGNFINSLQYLLPCEECKEHYKKYIVQKPPPKEPWLLFQWLLNLENQIARKNYGTSYRFINRYEEIEKMGGVLFVETTNHKHKKVIKKKKAPCHNCKERKGISRESIPGLGARTGGNTFNSNNFFGRKI